MSINTQTTDSTLDVNCYPETLETIAKLEMYPQTTVGVIVFVSSCTDQDITTSSSLRRPY